MPKTFSRLFFGGAGRHHDKWHRNYHRRNLREKVAGMSPEDKRDFFRKMHEHRHFGHRDHFCEKETGKEDTIKDNESEK